MKKPAFRCDQVDRDYLTKISGVLKENLVVLSQIEEYLGIFFDEKFFFDEGAKTVLSDPQNRETLPLILDVLEASPEITPERCPVPVISTGRKDGTEREKALCAPSGRDHRKDERTRVGQDTPSPRKRKDHPSLKNGTGNFLKGMCQMLKASKAVDVADISTLRFMTLLTFLIEVVLMTLRIYNTLTGKKEDFVPLHEKQVRMYVCGVTVYDLCHIGHARSTIIFDMIYRYLRYRGYEVTYVRNFTDIDDKIINRANEEGVDYKTIAERYIA